MTRSEMIEAMARAIYAQEHSCQAPEDMSPPYSPRSKIGLAIAAATNALSAIEQAGMVVVPEKPSQEMMNAGYMRNAQLGGATRHPDETYAAMIESGRLK